VGVEQFHSNRLSVKDRTREFDSFKNNLLCSLAKDCGATAYVNDAFGAAHRSHASTAGIVAFIDGPHVAGKLMQKEVDFLYGCVEAPQKPLAAVIGGAKVSTKVRETNRETRGVGLS